MLPGENKKIALIYNEKRYKAKINMERGKTTRTTRTKLSWYADFEKVLHVVFRDEYQDILNKVEIDQENKSIILFRKVKEDEYIVKIRSNTYTNKIIEQEGSNFYDFRGIDVLSALYTEFQEKVSKAFKDSRQLRINRLKQAPKMPKTQNVITKVYKRNPDVVAEVLYRAKGKCERCGGPAPFKRATDGTDYLEVHHKKQLAAGGEDTVENTIATCPNCHRELHYGIQGNRKRNINR